MEVEHYTFHVEWWPGDDPVCAFTAHLKDGTYKIVPAVAVGPFCSIADVMQQASKSLDIQLSLW